MSPEASSSDISTIEVIFSEKGNILAQKSAQFRNKSSDFEHPIKIKLSNDNVAQIGKYVQLGCQINYVTSYGETDEKRNKDYDAIKLLCKIILSINKNMPGFEKIYNKAKIINSNIPTIYNELISNAQKSIYENLMKDTAIRNVIFGKIQETMILDLLRDKGVEKEKIDMIKNNKQHMKGLLLKYKNQITVNDIDWYSDLEAREELIHEAIKRDMKIVFFIRYEPYYFKIGSKNKAYMAPRILKQLNDRLKEPIRKGEDLINAFKASSSKIGAGLGIDLTKICIENIEEECNVKANAEYENDSKGMLVMTISFLLNE